MHNLTLNTHSIKYWLLTFGLKLPAVYDLLCRNILLAFSLGFFQYWPWSAHSLETTDDLPCCHTTKSYVYNRQDLLRPAFISLTYLSAEIFSLVLKLSLMISLVSLQSIASLFCCPVLCSHCHLVYIQGFVSHLFFLVVLRTMSKTCLHKSQAFIICLLVGFLACFIAGYCCSI